MIEDSEKLPVTVGQLRAESSRDTVEDRERQGGSGGQALSYLDQLFPTFFSVCSAGSGKGTVYDRL